MLTSILATPVGDGHETLRGLIRDWLVYGFTCYEESTIRFPETCLPCLACVRVAATFCAIECALI